MQDKQYLAATPRPFRRAGSGRASRGFAALFACALLSACVSGTSGDTACKDTSVDAPLTGEIKGNVVVPRGATCHLKANVAGDVNVKDGARIYVQDGTRIAGAFRAIGAAQVRFNLDNPPAVASLSNRPQGVPAPKIVVGSNLVIARNSHAPLEAGAPAQGGARAQAARIDVCTPGVCAADAQVKVGKSVKIKQNQVAVAMNRTAIGADLKCSSNDSAPVVMRRASDAVGVTVKGRRSGQCEQLREIVYTPPGEGGSGPALAAPAKPATPVQPKA
jgi:hypothetical protein